ncbi:DUF2071 domain-containing protein [Priestia megaterium]|nr:DUF2071 domain-containing protein [Priestia megaterium]
MDKGWFMKQTWSDLLFVHWPVAVQDIQTLIPKPLQIDTFKGEAWISLVPFTMTGIHFKGVPKMPFLSSLYELNIRTYVKYKGKAGVYFFSLDANSPTGVCIARRFFHLPYLRANIHIKKQQNHTSFESIRIHKGFQQETIKMNYEPISQEYKAAEGTLSYWLTERYNLFTVYKENVFQGRLYHKQWSLKDGSCYIEEDTLTVPYNRPQNEEEMLIHYSERLDAYFYPFNKV